MTGDETLNLGGGTLNINGTSTLNAFTHLGGTLGGTGAVTVSGNAALGSGVQTGTGTTVLQGATTLSGNFALDAGRTVQNTATGTFTWTAGALNLDSTSAPLGGTFQNDGLFIASGSGANTIFNSHGSGVFLNHGTFRRSGTTASHTSTIFAPFNNTGTVEVQTGILAVASSGFTNAGTIDTAAGATFRNTSGAFTNNGTLVGNGTYDPLTTLTNAGTIAPGNSVGALTVAGGLTQTAAGAMEFELASLASFDTLDVLGNLTLDGTLEILSLGGYNPNAGDSFTLITFDDGVADASDLSGTFAHLVFTGFGAGIGFDVSYLTHSVVVTATFIPPAIPVPAAAWLLGSGMLGVFGAARRKRRG